MVEPVLARAATTQLFHVMEHGADLVAAAVVHVMVAVVQADIREAVPEVEAEEVTSPEHLLRLLR